MGFLSSLRGLIKHEPVVTSSPTKRQEKKSSQPTSHIPVSSGYVKKIQPSVTSQTRVTTQRPAPTTPSPRAHA